MRFKWRGTSDCIELNARSCFVMQFHAKSNIFRSIEWNSKWKTLHEIKWRRMRACFLQSELTWFFSVHKWKIKLFWNPFQDDQEAQSSITTSSYKRQSNLHWTQSFNFAIWLSCRVRDINIKQTFLNLFDMKCVWTFRNHRLAIK